jgi:hypothetical protein
MSVRCLRLLRMVSFSVAVLLLASSGLRAGDRVLSTTHPAIKPAPPPTVRPLIPMETVGVTVSLPRPAVKEPTFIQLRGPDGRVRSFPIEGGTDAITYTSVVLRPGQSVTIHLAAAK